MKTYILSPSSLNLFRECPRCFWLQLNRGIKRPAGMFPSLPRGMDSVIKKYFDQHRRVGSLPLELQELQNTRLFDDQTLLDEWRNNFKGISWTNEQGNTLRGAVDDLLLRGEAIVVLDYKTRGSPPNASITEYYRLQMECYNLLLRMNEYTTTDFSLLLFYFPNQVLDSGMFSFSSQLVQVNTFAGNALSVFDNAIKTLNQPIPRKGCAYCENKTYGGYNTDG